MRAPRVRRGLAVLALGAFFVVFACGPAAAASANWVGVAQTVVVATTATGKVSGKPEVFTQYSARGKGPATLRVPMSASGFRNLSGFGTAPIKDGYAVWNLHLSGTTHARSVAHFPTAKLPLQVTVAYELNGKKIKANDIVGKSGELKVTYVIKNVTTKATKVTFKNVLGSEETTTVKAPVPIAADLSVSLPADFTNLKGPGASASGNGNGTSSASWTLFLFNPLGGVKQSVTYQAHVTDAVVPSATLEGAVLPPQPLKPLPSIKEPGAPAVPVVTLGANLVKIQAVFQGFLAKLAAKASAALSAFKQVAVPAIQGVSAKAATVASGLPADSAAALATSINAQNTSATLAQTAVGVGDASTRMAALRSGVDQASAGAADASTRMAAVKGGLSQAAAEAADAARRMGDIRTGLETLPPAVRLTPAYRAVHAKVVALEALLAVHAARLAVATARAGVLADRLAVHAVRLRLTAAKADVLAVGLTRLSGLLTRVSGFAANVLAPAARKTSTGLLGLTPVASALSTKAAQTATTLANATLGPRRPPKRIPTKQIGGGAHLDKAVSELDGAITEAANKVDAAYAYLAALDKQAADNKLPAGNAKGATGGQVGALVYSVSGANNTAHETHLAVFIGGMALLLGIPFGIAFYRIRRRMPSSLAPPKSSPAAAKG